MKNITKKSIAFLILVIAVNFCMGQNTDPVKTVLTADSLKSGNTKDVLTSFFQLAFNNLTGNNKELNFNSNPFAIMLKSDQSLAIDSNYYKYRALRKTNFAFGIKLDSSYRFNGFSSGIKYALIDKRDSSTSKLLFNSLGHDELGKEEDSLQKILVNYAKTLNVEDRKKFIVKSVHDFFNVNTSFDKLDASFKQKVKEIVASDSIFFFKIYNMVNYESSSNILSEKKQIYDSLRNLIKNNLLWTVGVSDTTYKDQFFFSNILLKTELIKGINKYKSGSNWEFDIQASVNLLNDTLTKRRNLKRGIFNFEPGINWVVRNKNNDISFLELKFSGSYNLNFGNLYANEKQDSLTLNGTFRVRIIDDIWIPLEIKYDPKSGNVFGFINVRANFTALGNLLKPKSKS